MSSESNNVALGIDLAERVLCVLIEEGVLARNGRVFQKLRALIDASPRGGSNPSEEVEEVAACLGDDAAAMLDENPEDERALNMQRAAELLTELQPTSSIGGSDAINAERYRWLRDNNGVRNQHSVEVYIDGEAFAPGHLDAQVDDAMQATSDEAKS